MRTTKYTCFICWESFSLADEKEKEKVISCCRCFHNDYKYAHIRCMKYWINSSNGSNKQCNVCCTPYVIQTSRVSFTTIIKKYWHMTLIYLLLLAFAYTINMITWARLMIPATVYIVTPKYNKETHQYEKDDNPEILYVGSTFTQKVVAVSQTIMVILFSIYLGRLSLMYMESKTNTRTLIGMSPDNRILSIDLNEGNCDSCSDDEEQSLLLNNEIINNLNSTMA